MTSPDPFSDVPSAERKSPRKSPRTSAAGPAGVLPGFVTRDPHTLSVLREALVFAPSTLSLLVEGPSGTGKELVARGLHLASGRSAWVAVNCGALPESLQEAELFGAKRGAYTGAATDRRGLVEAADGGTLFLDEVGEMTASMQAKLLRFLELGEVRRLGETDVRTVSVRVIAATNRNLVNEVRAGRFRGDLYYRLCGAHIVVPGLDRRRGDVDAIARHMIRRLQGRGLHVAVDAGFFDALESRPWPGNARELKQVVERVTLLADAERRPLTADDVPVPVDVERTPVDVERAPVAGASACDTYADRVAAFERRLIVDALERTGWNKSRAAAYLGGLKRTTLLGKMQRLGIGDGRTHDPEPEPPAAAEGYVG